MPLKSGKENMGKNIMELMHKFKKTGKMGKSSPKNYSKARKQAIAIAFKHMEDEDKD